MPVITALVKLEFIAVVSTRLPRRGMGGRRRRELPPRRAGEVAAAGGGVFRTKVHFVRRQV